ncbi:MAG: phosphotransferase family protein [Acidimicrobiia bacterium]
MSRLRALADPIIRSDLVPSSTTRTLKRMVRRRRRLPGLPAGLEEVEVDAVCRTEWGRGLKGAFHLPIRSWKNSSASFVWLQLKGGGSRRLIAKVARYSHEVHAASVDSPLDAGRPELWAYTKAKSDLEAFLPGILLARRSDDGRSYAYLLEDLNTSFEHPSGPSALKSALDGMFDMHRALARAAGKESTESGDLLQYDGGFSERLVGYSGRALSEFAQITSSGVVTAMADRWDELAGIYLGAELSDHWEMTPIHGDYNTGNVFIRTSAPRDTKAVDWEWAGFGIPHADMASLLKKAEPDVIHWAMERLSQNDPGRTASQHQRAFNVSVLERAILDAGLVAVQYNSDPERFSSLESWIEGAATRGLVHLDRLAS